MKKRLIILLGLVLVCGAVIGFWIFRKPRSLVFVGYAAGKRIARFELRNPTAHPIYIVNKYPSPGEKTFLKKPIYVDTSGTNVGEEFYLPGKTGLLKDPTPCEILPGQTFEFQISLASHNNPEQIGVRYYTGHFKDRWDFYNKLAPMMATAPPNLTWKQRAKSYWDDFQKWLKRPRQHDVWCPEIVQP